MRLFRPVAVMVVSSLTVSAGDRDSVETIVHALYSVISGPAGTRDWARFRSLFAEGARLIPVQSKPGGTTAMVLTPEEYIIKRAGPRFERQGFYESEVASRVELFGSIAHVFSTYESRHATTEKPFARGINSIQLVKAGRTWKIMTVLWDSEREGNPIPQRYLK